MTFGGHCEPGRVSHQLCGADRKTPHVGIFIQFGPSVARVGSFQAAVATPMTFNLREQIGNSAFAFRGYNIDNLGRTNELLNHHAYGPVVKELLTEASEIASDAAGEEIDLVRRVSEKAESNLDTFAADMAQVIATELAQIRILEQFFDLPMSKAKVMFGYSLGEVAALIASDVYGMRDLLTAPLTLAGDCAELARDVTMGVLFSRGPALDFAAVERLCIDINAEGNGVIDISTFLSPNTLLLLGQNGTIDTFRKRMHDVLPEKAHLRKNDHSWPPLHTSLLWEKSIPNRAAVLQHTMVGGFKAPEPPIISCVTGKTSYNDHNSREILNQWIDHPQKLWDVVYETLSMGIDVVIHVGPEPNLIPATFKRLSDNVSAQLKGRSLNSVGLRAMSGMVRRPWLSKMLSSRAALLRAPFVQHIILEDWLLEQSPPS